VNYRLMQVAIGPGSEARYRKQANDDYQKY